MQKTLQAQFVDGASLAANYDSEPVKLSNATGYSVQLAWTGTPVGDFTLQASNDGGSTWSTITGTTVAAGGVAGSHVYNTGDAYYWEVRVHYESGSSSGTLSGWFAKKGM